MIDYVEKVQSFLEKYRDQKQASVMSKYMKNNFPFLGIAAPKRKELFKIIINSYPVPNYDDSKIFAKQFFHLEEREFHYFAILLLIKHKKQWSPTDIVFFEHLIVTKPWWDTVDIINSKIIAVFFKKYPNLAVPMTDAWSESKNIWLKRVSIIYQLPYHDKTNVEILERHILENAEHTNFFVQKGIGWALREYSKTDYKWVLNFIMNNISLKPLSKREAIKWIDSKGLIQ